MGKVKDKIPKPRKKRYLKEKFFEGFFAFWFSRGGVFLSIIISGLSFYFLKLDATKDWWVWLVFFCLTYGSPAIIRFKYFRGIPDGWTRGQAEEYQKLKGKTKKIVDSFSRKYWLVVLCIVSIFVGVGIAFKEIGLVAIVPGILTIAFFGYVFKIAYQARSKVSDAQVENDMALSKALHEAKYGKHHRKWMLSFIGFSIGMLPVMMLLGGNALLFAPIYFGVLIFILKKARAKFSGRIEFGGSRGGGVGGFRAPSPLKESDWRDREQEKRYDAKREWESKHWD